MLGGESRIEFRSDGVQCTIQFPLQQSRAQHPEEEASNAQNS
jgi:hypothetical protein